MTPRLSTRQQQILALVAEGHTNPEIAVKLGLTENTVKSHLDHIFNRLDANGRANAVAVAFRAGVLS